MQPNLKKKNFAITQRRLTTVQAQINKGKIFAPHMISPNKFTITLSTVWANSNAVYGNSIQANHKKRH